LQKKVSDSIWRDFMWEPKKADDYVTSLIQSAKTQVILVDPYVDSVTISRLSKRWNWVKAVVYCSNIKLSEWQTKDVLQDQENNPIKSRPLRNFHDRYLIIDNDIYRSWSSFDSHLWKKGTNISKVPNKTPEERLKELWIKS
jgi:hypothetical protein